MRRARATAFALFAAAMLIAANARAQPIPPGSPDAGLIERPSPAPPASARPDGSPAPPPPSPLGLRGGLDQARSGATSISPRPIVRRPPNYLLETPRPPRARVQRPTQGAMQRGIDREVNGRVRRQVFDPRASTIESGAPEPQPVPRRRRPPEADAFAPQGIRIGSFILRPAIEAGLGWTDNANTTATGRTGAAFSRVAVESTLDSDWRVHALGLRLRIERQDFRSEAIDPRLIVDGAANLRLDLTRDTQVEAGLAYRRAPDSSSTTALPVAAVGRPAADTRTATAGITQRFGRASMRLRGQYDQQRYGDTNFADGSTVSNRVRDVDVTTVTLRSGFDVTAGLTPFVEGALNRREFREDIGAGGVLQGSTGAALRGGIAFDFAQTWRGEIAIGHLVQRPRDGTLADLTAVTIDGSLDWTISPLTTLRAALRTGIIDTQTPGAFGAVARDVTVTLEHALRRNVLVSGTIGYGYDDFAGVTRTDRRLTATLAATWRLNRELALRVQANHQRVRSTDPANTTNVTTIEGGLRYSF